jgi:two-component system, NtrC family, response regulator HydG
LPPNGTTPCNLPRLVDHFLEGARARNPKTPLVRLAPEAIEALTRYSWPGNVRELEHLIERLAVLARSDEATLADLPQHVASPSATPARLDFGDTVLPIREIQRRYAGWALERFGGAKMSTCDAFGIDSKTLSKWLSSEGSRRGSS